jgi:uncharacterized membrane protein
VSAYEAYKLVHVLAAVAWVGGHLALHALHLRARGLRTPDDTQPMAEFALAASWLGGRVFVPSALVLLVFGHLTAAEADIDFGVTWIWASQLIWLASFVAGATFLGPEGSRLGKVIETDGFTPAVEERWNRVLLAVSVETVLLVLAVGLMVVKPA